MGSKRVTSLAFSFTILLLFLLAGFANSNLDKDREECADKLVGLASCLPYVGGEAKTPTIDCCSGLKVVLDKSKKCICILIKDRDDPKLGFKINATLAVQLPSACHAPANISECVDLLHLAPNSPEAKVFEGFEKSTKKTVPPHQFPVMVLRRDQAQVQVLRKRVVVGGERGGWWQRWFIVGFYHLFSYPTSSSS